MPDHEVHTLPISVSAVVGTVAGLGATVTVLRQLLVDSKRSRVVKPKAFQLPSALDSRVVFDELVPDLDQLFVGRDTIVESLTRGVQSYPVLFIDGPSGVGKSTLLKLGVARQLAQTKSWLPLFIDMGAMGDWESGPREALADALQVACEFGLPASAREALNLRGAVTSDGVFSVLQKLRPITGRRPVLIFDQLDDYQNNHWDRFVEPTVGSVTSTQQLLADNSFWRDVAQSIDSESAHMICALRSDATNLFHSLRFIQPKYHTIQLLASSDFRTLTESLIAADAVSKPENGFRDLVDRLSDDLRESSHSDGILPIRLRIVLSGMASLKQRELTTRALDRAGGVDGLEMAYVERNIEGIPGGKEEVLRLLAALVSVGPDSVPKAVSKTLNQLSNDLHVSQERLASIVESLARQRIVRDRGVLGWQLYHDYIAGAVLKFESRRRVWQDRLTKRAKSFDQSSGISRFGRLLSPLELVQLGWNAIRGRVQLGANRRFVALSSARLVLNMWSPVIVAGLLFFDGLRSERRGIQLAGTFDHRGNIISEAEAASLWEISGSPSSVRRAVIEEFMRSPLGAERFLLHQHALRRALFGFDSTAVGPLVNNIVEENCFNPTIRDPSQIGACAVLIYETA